MSAKLSSFVLYPIRLQLLVFIPKYNLLPAILTTPLLLALFLRAERVKFGYIERQNFRTKNGFRLDCWNVSVYCAFEQLISTVSTNRDETSRTGIVSNIANLWLARLHTILPIFWLDFLQGAAFYWHTTPSVISPPVALQKCWNS